MADIDKIFNERNDAIKFVDDYGSMIPEVKIKTAEEPEPEPSKAQTKCKKSPLREEFINNIKNDEKIQMSKYLKNIFLSYSIIFSKIII